MLQGWRIFRGPAVVRIQLEFQVSKRQRGMKGLLGLKGAVSRKSLMLKTGGQECLNSNDPEYVTQECIWLRKDGVSQASKLICFEKTPSLWCRATRSVDETFSIGCVLRRLGRGFRDRSTAG